MKRTSDILPFINLEVRLEKDNINRLKPNVIGCYTILILEQWSKSIEYFYQLPDDNSALASICNISKQKFELIRPKLEHLLTKTESGLSFRHIELLWYDVKQDQEKKDATIE